MAVHDQLISSFLGSYKFPTLLGQEILQSSEEKIAYRVYRRLFKNQNIRDNIFPKNVSGVDTFTLTQNQLFDAILQWKFQQNICKISSVDNTQAFLPEQRTVADQTLKVDSESPSSNDTHFMQIFANHFTGNTTRSAPQANEKNSLLTKDPFLLAYNDKDIQHKLGKKSLAQDDKNLIYDDILNFDNLNKSKLFDGISADETPASKYYTPTNEKITIKPNNSEMLRVNAPNNSPISLSEQDKVLALQEDALNNFLVKTSNALMSESMYSNKITRNILQTSNINEKPSNTLNSRESDEVKQGNNKIRMSIESIDTQASYMPPAIEDIQENLIDVQNFQDEISRLRFLISNDQESMTTDTVKACYSLFGLDFNLSYCSQQITLAYNSLLTTIWLNFWFGVKAFVEAKPQTKLSLEYLNLLEQFENLPNLYETIKKAYEICIIHVKSSLFKFNKTHDLQFTDLYPLETCRKLALSDLEFLIQQLDNISSDEIKTLRRKVIQENTLSSF